MARPQVEDGHCDIANELLEAIIRTHFTSAESKVFWAIVRKTYGWRKKTDSISYSQFESLTGLNRRHVGPVLKSLIKKNIVLCSNAGERKTSDYGVQKDYERWCPLPKSDTETSVKSDTEIGNSPDTDISASLTPIRVTDKKTNLTPISVPSDTEIGTNLTPISVSPLSPPSPIPLSPCNPPEQKQIQKSTYGEFLNVLLTGEEYEKLKVKPGQPQADDLIEQLSGYMRQSPANAKKYIDHYATILNWSRRDGRKDGQSGRDSKAFHAPARYTRPEEL